MGHRVVAFRHSPSQGRPPSLGRNPRSRTRYGLMSRFGPWTSGVVLDSLRNAGPTSQRILFGSTRDMRYPLATLGLAALLATGCTARQNPMAPASTRASVANYTVTFTSTWSAATHPMDFPG